ncbi:MAG TPA: periplasmic heavy metal sensor [Vicinamibacterales bacterium]
MTKRLGHVALALAGATALAAVFAAIHASAQDQNTSQAPAPFMGRGRGGPMGPGGPMGMLPMLPRELELTPTQQDQIKAIAQTHHDEWKALADRARSAHDALSTAVSADTLDETTIRLKSADVAAVDADMAVARAHVHAEVMQVLTSDQKTKLKTLKAQFSGRRQVPRGQH